MAQTRYIYGIAEIPGYRRALEISSGAVFILLLATYWTTIPWSVSYWDCPEYVTGAFDLVPGHPPGNPLWILIERVISMLSFTGIPPVILINMSSGFFTAGACYLISRVIFNMIAVILVRNHFHAGEISLACAGAAVTGALAFGWCDSAWYSAVEAEVYAMSIFFSSLTIWLMMEYALMTDRAKATRCIVLTAYIIGLSIGVHQLNLLVIPAFALIFAFRYRIKGFLKLTAVVLLSLASVACILLGMMPSSVSIAGKFELFCVNSLHLPFLSGVIAYCVVLLITGVASLWISNKKTSPLLKFLIIYPFLFLSGFFIFHSAYTAGVLISIVTGILFVSYKRIKSHLSTILLMMGMIIVGFSVYGVILIRGDINSPINSSLPGNPFSLLSYISRDQYGASPLVYGKTPYSKSLMKEETDNEGKKHYKSLLLEKVRPIYSPAETDLSLNPKKDFFTEADSAFNAEALSSSSDKYVIDDYSVKPVYTPELNMWFPRITSSDPRDIDCFDSWVGMNKESMVKEKISETVDSAGNYVTKADNEGNRQEKYSYRPTYLQSAAMLFSYQIGYMYLRYLMWNFCGRQNDIASTGEVEHGNFITGFPLIDNAMLGAEESLPYGAGEGNPGRNVLYMLPLLLGIVGIIWLFRKGKIGRQTLSVITALFLMTGMAIVIYLNQSPGEPRERDYSFMGSFLAYSVWIGCGATAVALGVRNIYISIRRRFSGRKLTRRAGSCLVVAGFIPSLGVVTLMATVNHDDHDRSDRSVAFDITANLLNSLDENAILFVDGDNYTFPLWYAQEVEGIRRDVKVINLAYLSMPRYAATLLLPWRETDGIDMTAGHGNLAHKAFFTVNFADSLSSDTVRATDMLKELYRMRQPEIKYKFVSIPSVGNDSIVVDLKKMAKTDGYVSLMQRRLVMLDIVATNAGRTVPRPVYWQRSLQTRHFSPYLPAMSHDLLAWKWGVSPTDSSILNKASRLRKPNRGKPDVYMDEVPKAQINSQRAGVVIAAADFMKKGDYSGALSLAEVADTVFGQIYPENCIVMNADTLFNVARNLGDIYIEAGRVVGDSASVKRGMKIRGDEGKRRDEWKHYRNALPPRLKGKMRPH